MASGVLRAVARSDSPDGCRSAATEGEALNARAPGIEIASPAAAPTTTRRMLGEIFLGRILPWIKASWPRSREKKKGSGMCMRGLVQALACLVLSLPAASVERPCPGPAQWVIPAGAGRAPAPERSTAPASCAPRRAGDAPHAAGSLGPLLRLRGGKKQVKGKRVKQPRKLRTIEQVDPPSCECPHARPRRAPAAAFRQESFG